jgi:thioredoxin reductase (NADPH)
MSEKQHYDVVILGVGPAGMQAAIHAARRKVSVIMIGKTVKSSLFHAHIENFCCIFNLSGEEMLNVGHQQAIQFGAEIRQEDVLHIKQADGPLFDITIESGQVIQGKSLIIATGATRNRLGVAGEKELLGKGVSYCVECDGNFFRGQDVAVVGNESAAVGGALTLAKEPRKVHLVAEKIQVVDALGEQLGASDVIIHQDAKVEAIEGDGEVKALLLKDGTRLDVNGVFIELGAKGVMELAATLGVMLDETGKYIQTDKKQKTNLDGIYAAGDICGPPWQMAKAVGEGCVAGLEAAGYARKLKL